jgi:hypothetical protein
VKQSTAATAATAHLRAGARIDLGGEKNAGAVGHPACDGGVDGFAHFYLVLIAEGGVDPAAAGVQPKLSHIARVGGTT